MATIEIPNVRQESTVLMPTTLKDNGVAVDWSGLQNIKAYMYSDAQRVIAGKCDVEVDGEDATVLKVTYAATRPQYLGVNSLLVRCKYHGREKSYDVPVLNFVERTAQATGVTELDDPVIDVKLEVDEVSTSLLDGAIAAALDAAVKAGEAASLVPLQVLEDCVEATENAETATAAANEAAAAASAAGITSVQASVADNEPGTPSVDAALLNKVLSLVFHHLKGVKGDTGATPNISVGTVTTGAPGTPVVITMTGTAEAPVLNITIPQGLKGDQGNTGSSVEFPYELVNNLTTNDPTKGLSAAQGVVLKTEISQLDQKVEWADVPVSPGYVNTNGTSISATNRNGSPTVRSVFIPVSAGDKVRIFGKAGTSNYYRFYATANSSLTIVEKYTGSGDFRTTPMEVTIPSGVAYIAVNFTDYDASKDKVLVWRSSFTTVQDSFNELKNELAGRRVPSYSFTVGGVGPTGTIGTSNEYAHTSEIELKKGETITVVSRGYSYAPISLVVGGVYSPVAVVSSNPGSGVSVTSTYTALADCLVVACVKCVEPYDIFIGSVIYKMKDSINVLDQEVDELGQEVDERVKLATKKNYSPSAYMYKQDYVAAAGWNISDFIPITEGAHSYIWQFGYGAYSAASNPCLVWYDEDFKYINFISSSGYYDTRTATYTIENAAFIRVSFYDTRADGSRNDVPVIIDGTPFRVIRDGAGVVTDADKMWKPLPLGPLINCDVSSGELSPSETYDPVRVTMKNILTFPKLATKIRLRAKRPYFINVFFWYGKANGSVTTTTGSSLFDGTEWTMPADIKSFRIVIRATKTIPAVGVGWQYRQQISASDIQAAIDSGDIAFEYLEGEELPVKARNESKAAMVYAVRRVVNTTSNVANGMNLLPVFAHISDLHGDAARFINFMEFCDAIGGVDFAVNSGDATLYDHPDGTSWVDAISDGKDTPLLFCIGNHEAYPTGVSTLFSDNMQALVTQQGYLKAANTPADKCYYYKDFDGKKIRAITLNYYEDGVYAGKLGQTQINWFVNTLASTPSDYGVVVILHSPEDHVVAPAGYDKFMQPSPKYGDTYQPGGFYVGDRPIMKIVDAFISKTTLTESYTENGATVNISADFTGVAETTEFIAYVTGHRHEDNVGYYEHSENRQLCLGVVCGIAHFGDSTNSAWTNQCDLPRGDTGVVQDAFNLYAIDRAGGNVRIVRVGANVTTRLALRDMLVIPYKD